MSGKKLSLGLLFLMVALVVVPGASANTTYYTALKTVYGSNMVCLTCHTSTGGPPPFTPYGTLFSANSSHFTDPAGVLVSIGPPPLTVAATPATVVAGTPTSVTFTVTTGGAGGVGAVPIIGATVTLTGNATGTGTTDASGHAVISVNAATAGIITATASETGFKSGTTTLTANAPAVLPMSISASPTTVTAGTATSVTFTVTSSGAAVSGATVTLTGNATGTGTTDASGHAVISVNAATAGIITATATKTGYTSASTTLTANAPTTGTATVTFVVTDNKTGRPVYGAEVSLNGTTIHTNYSGLAIFTNVATGTYSMEISKDGYKDIKGNITVAGDTTVSMKLVRERVHTDGIKEASDQSSSISARVLLKKT